MRFCKRCSPPPGTSNEHTGTDATAADDHSGTDALNTVDSTIPIARKQHTPSLSKIQETSTTAQGRDCDSPGDPATEQRVQMFSHVLRRTFDGGENPDALFRDMLKRQEPPTIFDTSSKATADLSELHSVAGGQQTASQQRNGLFRRL